MILKLSEGRLHKYSAASQLALKSETPLVFSPSRANCFENHLEANAVKPNSSLNRTVCGGLTLGFISFSSKANPPEFSG